MIIDRVTLTFTGRLVPASFAEFARHRAGRLSVALTELGQSERMARMRVEGQRDLVDAFEMAMSLGPADCIVIDVSRDAAGGDETQKDVFR